MWRVQGLAQHTLMNRVAPEPHGKRCIGFTSQQTQLHLSKVSHDSPGLMGTGGDGALKVWATGKRALACLDAPAGPYAALLQGPSYTLFLPWMEPSSPGKSLCSIYYGFYEKTDNIALGTINSIQFNFICWPSFCWDFSPLSVGESSGPVKWYECLKFCPSEWSEHCMWVTESVLGRHPGLKMSFLA